MMDNGDENTQNFRPICGPDKLESIWVWRCLSSLCRIEFCIVQSGQRWRRGTIEEAKCDDEASNCEP